MLSANSLLFPFFFFSFLFVFDFKGNVSIEVKCSSDLIRETKRTKLASFQPWTEKLLNPFLLFYTKLGCKKGLTKSKSS